MKYTFEKAEKSTVKVTIELAKEEWQEANVKAYEKTKGRYSMPGFRKGKVPKKVLENAYGVCLFYEDAINYAFPQYLGEILDKEPSIEAIDRPELDIQSISEEGITMIAIIPVKPDVKLGAYKGLTFKKNTYRVKKTLQKDIKDCKLQIKLCTADIKWMIQRFRNRKKSSGASWFGGLFLLLLLVGGLVAGYFMLFGQDISAVLNGLIGGK